VESLGSRIKDVQVDEAVIRDDSFLLEIRAFKP